VTGLNIVILTDVKYTNMCLPDDEIATASPRILKIYWKKPVRIVVIKTSC
jgi:hypothetical protein